MPILSLRATALKLPVLNNRILGATLMCKKMLQKAQDRLQKTVLFVILPTIFEEKIFW